MQRWRCTVCNYVYDPAEGDPDGGVTSGTAFEEIPDDWLCPVCQVGKEHFAAAHPHNKNKKTGRSW